MYGRADYNDTAFKLLDEQNARALSIAFDPNDYSWLEVSHVPHGRVSEASAMFAGGSVFDYSIDETCEMIRAELYECECMQSGGYIEGMYDGYAIVFSSEDGLLKIPYTISTDGVVALGDPEPVDRQYTPRRQSVEDAEPQEGMNMSDGNKPQKDEGVFAKLKAFLRQKGVDASDAELAATFAQPTFTPAKEAAPDTVALQATVAQLNDTVAKLSETVMTFASGQQKAVEEGVETFLASQVKEGRIPRSEIDMLRPLLLSNATVATADGGTTTVAEQIKASILARPKFLLAHVMPHEVPDGDDVAPVAAQDQARAMELGLGDVDLAKLRAMNDAEKQYGAGVTRKTIFNARNGGNG